MRRRARSLAFRPVAVYTGDASVAMAQEGKSGEASNKNTPNKEGLDATQKLWSSLPPQ